MTDNPAHRLDLQHLIHLQADARKLHIPVQQRVTRRQIGHHASRLRGRGMEFAEVRHYQPGDDIRSIDWRVTARRQTPHTKLYQEERERPELLVCDQGASLFFASTGAYKAVRAAETAALLAWHGLFSGDRVGGVLFSHRGLSAFRPMRRRKAVLHLLHGLVDFNQALEKDWRDASSSRLNDALTEARRIAHTGSRVIVISDFMHADDNTALLLKQLARHNQVAAVRVVDPLELSLPPRGAFAVSQGDQTLWFQADNKALRQAWEERVTQHEAHLRQVFRQSGVYRTDLITEDAPTGALRRLLLGG
ncbi:DUF58 domain-containing protein [Marinobacteraceae bacterium S3BR75-40.1]